jgi:carbon storage regulator
MLVLSRKAGESVRIGDDVRVTVLRIGPSSVRVGIEAPAYLGILREELEFELPMAELAGSAASLPG